MSVYVYDPTASDKLSAVRGVGRYLQILKENFPQWIFTNQLSNIKKPSVFINSFFNFFQPPISLRRLAKKQIAVIHDLIPLKYPNHFPIGLRGHFNIFLNKLSLKNYDLIITDSEASKSDIVNILQINEEKIEVIYPCLPKTFLKPKIKTLNLTKNSQLIINNFVLYVGDGTWNKNLVNLAKAIKIANVVGVFVGKIFEPIIKEARTPFLRQSSSTLVEIKQSKETVLNEHPWQKELKEFFQLAKDDKRFIFLGFLPDKDLFKLYKQSLLNILISRDEGFGFSYLEASYFSCPSLLSDISVLREISDNQTIYANPENPHEIADKIIKVYFNKKLRIDLGQKVKKQIKKYSSENFKNNFLKVIS